MGETEKQPPKFTNVSSDSKGENREEQQTSHDIQSKEHWDQFYTTTSCDVYSELYAEWPQLQSLLTSQLLSPSSSSLQQSESATGAPPPSAVQSEEVIILVPGCGNSRLSEHLYDAGFTNITNVDFSEVVISYMLNRNIRERPRMKWHVMDMTSMKFENETFDAVVDKEGLDGLMDPNLGPRLGNLYLSQVKRLLKAGGKYICVTLAKHHVLALLFPKFRFGWRVNLYAIAHEPSSGDLHQQAFMVVAEKLCSTVVSQISLFPEEYSAEHQAAGLYKALESEKSIRTRYSNASDIFCPLEDLILGVKANFTQLEPGQIVKLSLGEFGVSRFSYDCILFDAQRDSGPFSHQFGLWVVGQNDYLEWILSLSDGLWVAVKMHKAARVLMVVIDSRHSNVDMNDILSDLNPLVRQLAPGDCDDGVEIPFKFEPDGNMTRQIVHQVKELLSIVSFNEKSRCLNILSASLEVLNFMESLESPPTALVTSALTGPIVVDDVTSKNTDPSIPAKNVTFRRLTIQSFVQSQAFYGEKDQLEFLRGSKESRKDLFLTHLGLMVLQFDQQLLLPSVKIIGISLIPLFQLNTVVIGLRAGLLPMFMNTCLPDLRIEVVELDPVILDVATNYFDFRESRRLKVHVTDAIKFVREKAESDAEGKHSSKVDILIVDVDSPNSTPGFTCPPAEFFEESFLLAVKKSLSEDGIFIINFISWSSAVKDTVYSRLKMVRTEVKVFSNLFVLQPEDDIFEVIFALKTGSPINEDEFSEDCDALARSLELEKQEWIQRIIVASKLIKPLR
ncbi:hypothetical protein DH2020_043398 [Rehmannia glutinosa]|uniref:Methyltransferase domain-containing protein n=1 Tax=Rehmannia glutinosa TaxID=99300 RepID=A0ABR0UKI4_REHGL